MTLDNTTLHPNFLGGIDPYPPFDAYVPQEPVRLTNVGPDPILLADETADEKNRIRLAWAASEVDEANDERMDRLEGQLLILGDAVTDMASQTRKTLRYSIAACLATLATVLLSAC